MKITGLTEILQSPRTGTVATPCDGLGLTSSTHSTWLPAVANDVLTGCDTLTQTRVQMLTTRSTSTSSLPGAGVADGLRSACTRLTTVTMPRPLWQCPLQLLRTWRALHASVTCQLTCT